MTVHEPVFPILAFWSGKRMRGESGNERFREFKDVEALRLARWDELRPGEWLGMALVDDAGGAWTIREVHSVGYRTPFWLRGLMWIMNQGGDIEHAVECRLEQAAPIPFAEVQQRVCASIDRNPYDWVDDEAVAGEAGPPLVLADALEPMKSAVMRATKVSELFDGLDAAWS